MAYCPSCSSRLPDASRFCHSCGSPVDSSGIPTILDGAGSSAPGHLPSAGGEAISCGRFETGATVAGRYRIIGRIGSGGMGEVYRADDLKLGQPVALKFLPPLFASDPGRLARFHNEVRIARQVSHPNVCRVYDIGEAGGQHFISMEYVDGEDLSSLLRRIGRLPADKAVEIARQMCAGLAAAHERGVLHRDLKPSNVMLDGRGKARLTDFGLAGLEAELKGASSREGTPYYMAPEQLAGSGVTVRSDLYSLGLVLYEMLTGRPPFKADTIAEMSRLREESRPETPSSMVMDLDPAMERVILRCLERDPADRPASALAVAAALPGADPLAAALAAGETPSPEMVAAAGDVGGIGPGKGALCLAGVVAGLIVAAALGPRMLLTGWIPLEHPPQVLETKARETIGRLGYGEPPADSAGSFATDAEALLFIERNDTSFDRWERLRPGRPAAVQYWHRQSPRSLEAADFFGHVLGTVVVEPTDPPVDLSGMVGVRLDTLGRLVELTAVPQQVEREETPAAEFEWERLLREAGLDPAWFRPDDPEWLPPSFADSRRAWVRVDPAREDLPGRVEAAAYRGRPVYFQMVWPWTRPARMRPYTPSRAERANQIILLAMFVSVIVGGLLVARHNLRLGRGDRRGAMKLALFVVSILMLDWLFRASHVMTFWELGMFVMGASGALFGAALVWVLYIALEPYVRRRWPGILISWNRLLAGRLRDPLVGRDILLGSLFGIGICLFVHLVRLVVYWLRWDPSAPVPAPAAALMGIPRIAANMMLHLPIDLFSSLAVLFLLFVLRLFLRRGWVAALVLVLIFAVRGAVASTLPAVGFVVSGALWTAIVYILVRFGLLALVALFYVLSLAQGYLLTLDPTAWYAGSAWLAVLIVLALAGHGLRAALAGRSLLGARLLEE